MICSYFEQSITCFVKEKTTPEGIVDKVKARVVAGGNQQDKSIYTSDETSSYCLKHIIQCCHALAPISSVWNRSNDPIIILTTLISGGRRIYFTLGFTTLAVTDVVSSAGFSVVLSMAL